MAGGFGLMQFVMLMLVLALAWAPAAVSWSKEGHIVTCRIAQSLLEPDADYAVKNLLPSYVDGDLSALCVWADQIRHWHKYSWSSPLHFIDTPDEACTFEYKRDCHDPKGKANMCVAGAIRNYTSQLLHYKHGTSDRKYNLTEALLFLSHFMGDIHQPLHCGFTSDEGGNTIHLRWYRHKSNLHHVWDREIILTALSQFYDKDLDAFQQDLQKNLTNSDWAEDISTWDHCEDFMACPTRYGKEGITLACKWAYEGVSEGDTLSDDYFYSRLPIVEKRLAQGGVRLAMYLNYIFGDTNSDTVAPT